MKKYTVDNSQFNIVRIFNNKNTLEKILQQIIALKNNKDLKQIEERK